MQFFSLPGKMLFSIAISVTVGIAIFVFCTQLNFPKTLSVIAAIVSSIVTGAILSLILTHSLLKRIAALESGLLNLLDNEYSTSITPQGNGEFDRLISLYNDLSQQLRNERQKLYQRELLLDTVIQNSDLALLLVDGQERVVYCNAQSQSLFGQNIPLPGMPFSSVIEKGPEALSSMMAQNREGLISFTIDKHRAVYHLSIGSFTLHAEAHTLYLIKQLTREITRKEIEIWKKVIRVISHEINNSLAPISSMANSGKKLLERQNSERLKDVFDTISERSKHLIDFIDQYIRLARLPIPDRKAIAWQPLLLRLQQHYAFQQKGNIPEIPIYADSAQLEQALINLLKNAHESGSEISDVQLSLQLDSENASSVDIVVCDRGQGILPEALENVLLPLYTTKATGSGIGLALCSEIAEAHGGKLLITNRAKGGVEARLTLPTN